jgi:hypothetical protein
MALSIKKKGFSALLVVIAISLAMGMVWTPDTFGGSERLASFQTNTYSLAISLDPDAFAAAQTCINNLNEECGLNLIPLPYANVVLDNRFLRNDLGVALGEDMTVKLFVYAVELNPPSSYIETLVLVGYFSSNQNLVDYMEGKGLIPDDSSASEITGKYEEEKDESGTKVKGEIRVSDPNNTIDFETEFMKSAPEFEFGPSNLKIRFDSDPCRCFTTSHDAALYRYDPLPPDVFIDLNISLDTSSPGAAIFNGQNDVTWLMFSHQYVITDEIIP